MAHLFSLDTFIEVMLAISLSTAAGFRVFVPVEMLAASDRIHGGGKAQMPMWMRIAKGVG